MLRHHSDKNPVQRCLDKAANEVLAFRPSAYDANDWSTEEKGELLNMALAAVHLQCIDAGICYAQTGKQAKPIGRHVALPFVRLQSIDAVICYAETGKQASLLPYRVP